MYFLWKTIATSVWDHVIHLSWIWQYRLLVSWMPLFLAAPEPAARATFVTSVWKLVELGEFQ